jgi:eukaryotic-like serine/threonine-protein kinase
MASPAPSRPSGALIAKQYAVDVSRPLPSVGGLNAFRVTDQLTGRTDLMAVRIQRQLPIRPRALQALQTPIVGLLTPVAYGATSAAGSAEDACYMICLAPPGPSLVGRTRPWPEAELLECVLRPAAHVLEQLQARGLTHRGIRFDNVFQSRPGQPVVLGTAWAAPPAMAQTALFDPPYSAMCLPAGRGDGSIADDVYALGVLLLCLALGRAALPQLDDAAVIRRKLEQGGYIAIAGDERLPPIIGDLVRGMLAEDPEHRPTPTLLLDPASARGRRVAARPPRRAQRSITIADCEVWEARSLAHAMGVEADHALRALRSGTIVAWLRRGLGDALLATRLEDLVRHRSLDGFTDDGSGDATLVMRAIALLDPLAPLCWRGMSLWPDGIGAALAAAQDSDPDVMARLEEVIAHEEAGNWAAVRPERCDFAEIRIDARQRHAWLQQGANTSAMARLTYVLNPMLPCASPLMGGRWVVKLQELPLALEEAAGRVDRKTAPVDAHVAAFISARLERRLESELTAEAGTGQAAAICLAQLRLLAQLQSRFQAQPLPALAAWLAGLAEPVLATWHNRVRRAAVAEQLKVLAEAGFLAPLLAALDDPVARGTDSLEAQRAAEQLHRVDAELALIAGGAAGRTVTANRLGQEIAAGLGLAALATVLAVVALG